MKEKLQLSRGSDSFFKKNKHYCLCRTLHQGPIRPTFQCSEWPMTSCAGTTRSLWRHETSNTPAAKKKGGSAVQVKQEHSGVPALGVASWRHQPPRSSPSDSQNPTASLLLMSPHICSALTCSLCSLRGAWALVLKFFSQMYDVVRNGERKTVVVTLNECSKSAGAGAGVQCKTAKVLISLLCTFSVPEGDITYNHWQMSTGLFPDMQGLFCQLQIIHTKVALIPFKSSQR